MIPHMHNVGQRSAGKGTGRSAAGKVRLHCGVNRFVRDYQEIAACSDMATEPVSEIHRRHI